MQKRLIILCEEKESLKSELCVSLHKVGFEEIIKHLVKITKNCDFMDITIISTMADKIKKVVIDETIDYISTKQILGNGHAVSLVDEDFKQQEGLTLIINGDMPLLTQTTILDMVESYENNKYELIYNDLGIYAFNNQLLFKYLAQLKPNSEDGYYYLNDIVEIFESNQISNERFELDSYESIVIRDRVDLVNANLLLNEQQTSNWINNGVTILDPTSTYIGREVEMEEDVTIYPNTYLEGKVVIKKGAIVGPNARIINSYIGEFTTVDSSRVINSYVGNNVTVGPYAHLRDHCEIYDYGRIGNFVEMKKVEFKEGSKCAHLTYLGDCEVGEKVNIGCGTITVNYDGKKKFRTIIKDGAFIGSNSNLIAPVTIGKNALVAAGSTITQNVEDGDMGIARAKQVNKEGFGDKYKNKEKL